MKLLPRHQSLVNSGHLTRAQAHALASGMTTSPRKRSRVIPFLLILLTVAFGMAWGKAQAANRQHIDAQFGITTPH